MRARVFLALLALPLAACLDAGAEGTVGDGYHGTFVVEVEALNLDGLASALVDIAAGPQGAEVDWFRERAQWSPADGPVRLTVSCDVRDAPHRVEAHIVGVYDRPLEAPGAYGDPVPESLPYQDPGASRRDTTCVAGEEVLVHFDIALMKPAEQGFFDIAVNTYGDDAIRDGIWHLRLVNGESPPRVVWEQDVQSSIQGDGSGTFAYVGPCDAAPGAEQNRLTAELVGLYDTAQGSNGLAPIITSEPLEIWPLPVLGTTVECRLNQDVFVQIEAPIARVIRGAEGVRARFAGLTCDASWICSHGPPLESPLMAVTCETDDGPTPSLHLDAPVVRCEGADPIILDVADRVTTSLRASTEAPAVAGWIIAPELGTLPGGACVLEARATVLPADLRLDPTLPTAYPEVRWTIPLTDASGPRCDGIHLDVEGPLTVGYTTSDTPYVYTIPAETLP